MPGSPGFKPCAVCRRPMPTGDPHEACLKCLGEAHLTDKCRICKAFKPRMKKERDVRLKQLLMEAALTPHSSASAPRSTGSSAPEHTSAKTPSHWPSLASGSTQHRSTSPPCKKRKPPAAAVPAPQSEHLARPDHPALPSAAASTSAAPLTPASDEPSSPVPTSSPAQATVELVVPSTPEVFSAARDLIALTGPELPRPPAPPVRVPQSTGKLALVRPSSPGTIGLRHSRSQSRSRRRSRSRHRSRSRYHSPSRYRSWSRYRSRSPSPSGHYRHRSRSRHHSRHRASRSRS
ncbi:lysine-rich arabinogalactan protein 19-like [Gopherus evgoodei]|uniref:lysine-rich arabinogalactan protein 19-like n=1 Tax=Gopherus evgoodei TaxID=1825980 RepID=UPI0011CF5CF5|nr:lysine-rich arabinogalactan protein 19-like [Gopherus evgoodei]